MIENNNLGSIMGAPVVGPDDEKIGTVGVVFIDPVSNQPNWATVHTGLFGRHESFVPLDDAMWDLETLHISYPKETVKGAPRIDTDGELGPEEEAELYRYYERALPEPEAEAEPGHRLRRHSPDEADAASARPPQEEPAAPPEEPEAPAAEPEPPRSDDGPRHRA